MGTPTPTLAVPSSKPWGFSIPLVNTNWATALAVSISVACAVLSSPASLSSAIAMAPKVMSSSGMMCSLSMSHSLADRVSLMLLLESLMSSALASLELLVLVDLVGRSVGFGLA